MAIAICVVENAKMASVLLITTLHNKTDSLEFLKIVVQYVLTLKIPRNSRVYWSRYQKIQICSVNVSKLFVPFCGYQCVLITRCPSVDLVSFNCLYTHSL